MKIDINKLIDTKNIKLYDKGTHSMWTNEYISKYLLMTHLKSDVNHASRSETNINAIVDFITKMHKSPIKILDLGCGPGLYATKLSELGHDVVGIDFSATSIDYAKKYSKENNLNINYLCKSYLDTDYVGEFDLIIMIYCDLGALSKDEREIMVDKVYRALKPNGTFIFDALNENYLKEKQFNKDWDIVDKGFWEDEPYLFFSESIPYLEDNAVLDKNIIITDNEVKSYYFWNTYFNYNQIKNLFNKFKSVEVYKNILNENENYQDGLPSHTVNFYKVSK